VEDRSVLCVDGGEFEGGTPTGEFDAGVGQGALGGRRKAGAIDGGTQTQAPDRTNEELVEAGWVQASLPVGTQ
jgi:hypothetical protein